uniref:Uncharacterized protein n=1 Tax=Anguilla anguilla TaxID=7936 RepID=A0A0E9QY41_ANGAN
MHILSKNMPTILSASCFTFKFELKFKPRGNKNEQQLEESK